MAATGSFNAVVDMLNVYGGEWKKLRLELIDTYIGMTWLPPVRVMPTSIC